MVLLKHILKMAQLEPLYLRRGMFTGSFSMVVGVAVSGDDVIVDMIGLVGEGDEGVKGVKMDDSGTNELEGLVLACWAGPITCH